MISEAEARQARERAAAMLSQVGVVLTPAEERGMEVADFGLSQLDAIGLQIVTYVNNDRYCAKELVMFPRQTCPQHRHPPVGEDPGKMETLRCRWGTVLLYTEGEPSSEVRAHLPPENKPYHTVFREIELRPGEQYTIPPGALHWFQAGDEGAVISSFSSTSRDEGDVFSDPRVRRKPEIGP